MRGILMYLLRAAGKKYGLNMEGVSEDGEQGGIYQG